jgi:dihydrofolate synthase/folylpolyglutamate synthase
MTPAETLRWLTGLRNLGSRLGVDRMRLLSARLGRPERAQPCFHVAGTNGKGSTSAMIEAIQRAQGRRTGLYTSPHLVAIGERLQVDRVPSSDAAVVALAERLRPHYEAIRAEDPEDAPTFFELITAAALLEFSERKVDVAVLETGLGGRLDATNICAPEVCVITSIGFDHQEYLGPTLAAIAAEKAGILKPGVPVVVGDVPPEAEAVIVARAREVGAPVHFVRDRFAAGLPETNLAGEHQRRNAGAALLACELATRLPVDDAKARAALRSVEWAGRWQEFRLADGRRLIVDGSHNEEGIRAVAPLLAALNAPTVIVGALGAERAAPPAPGRSWPPRRRPPAVWCSCVPTTNAPAPSRSSPRWCRPASAARCAARPSPSSSLRRPRASPTARPSSCSARFIWSAKSSRACAGTGSPTRGRIACPPPDDRLLFRPAEQHHAEDRPSRTAEMADRGGRRFHGLRQAGLARLPPVEGRPVVLARGRGEGMEADGRLAPREPARPRDQRRDPHRQAL